MDIFHPTDKGVFEMRTQIQSFLKEPFSKTVSIAAQMSYYWTLAFIPAMIFNFLHKQALFACRQSALLSASSHAGFGIQHCFQAIQ